MQSVDVGTTFRGLWKKP